jgi:hypothetical protein
MQAAFLTVSNPKVDLNWHALVVGVVLSENCQTDVEVQVLLPTLIQTLVSPSLNAEET